MFGDELENMSTALDDSPLTEDQKLKIIEDARASFNDIEGVVFQELSDDEDANITADFKTARKVLEANVDRMEKITKIIFDTIAVQPENLAAIQTGMECINSQNQNLRLLTELKSKLLTNRQLQKKVSSTGVNNGGNGLPKGFTIKPN